MAPGVIGAARSTGNIAPVTSFSPKARGVKLGLNGARIAARHHREAVAYAATIEDHVSAARASGAKTLTAIAAYLNAHSIPSREGKLWHPSSVSRTVRRLDEAAG